MSNYWSEDLSHREQRQRELYALSPLQRAGLILDYEIILLEDSDPIEEILNHEFGPNSTSDCGRLAHSASIAQHTFKT